MTEMLLDTQKIVERLEAAGVPPAQARAHIAVLLDAISSLDAHSSERYAEKDHVARAIERLDTRITVESAAIRSEMQKLKSDLMKWVVSVAFLQVAATSFILKLAV